jgi:putative DNA primase/helicase
MQIKQAHAWVKKYKRVTESTLALTFAEFNGEQWRYNTEEGVWLQWVKTHWARRQTPELLDALRFFLTTFANAFSNVQIITHAEANRLQSQKSIAAIERICRALPSFLARSALFDADAFLLGTPGGTADLRDGTLRPANPADHITVITAVTPAPAGTPLGPRFEQFLTDITAGDADYRKTLRQLAGICAEGTSRDQKIMFVYGHGGNGKGVFLRTVAGLLGDHAVNAPRDLLMVQKQSQHPTALVDVLSARMVIITEIDEDATWDTALIKDLTGGDPIAVRRMRQDFYRMVARCTIIVSGNRKPTLKEVDEAVRRRFLVGTFPLEVKEADVIPDLEKEFIAEEGASILRWIIDGAVEREQEGRLHVAQIIREDTEDYFAEENVLKDFISTYLEKFSPAEDPPKMVETSEVFAVWRAYCGHLGRSVGARNTFTTAMKAAGVTYKRTNAGRYFLNVQLKLGQI